MSTLMDAAPYKISYKIFITLLSYNRNYIEICMALYQIDRFINKKCIYFKIFFKISQFPL